MRGEPKVPVQAESDQDMHLQLPAEKEAVHILVAALPSVLCGI